MITPTTTSLQKLLQGRLFEAAAVQRDYQWDTVECLTLLDDLDRAFLSSRSGSPFIAVAGDSGGSAVVETQPADLADDAVDTDDLPTTTLTDFAAAESPVTVLADSYYLGSIVLGPKGSEGRVSVYDGLQRITTLTILLAVLRDLSGSGALQKFIVDGGKPRVRLLVRDGSLYQEVQVRNSTLKTPSDQPATDTGERIRNAVACFHSAFADWSPEKRTAFTNYILANAIFVVIAITDAALAIQTFYTTNTRGKQLNASDLLKAQIVDLVAMERGGEVAETIAAQWTGLHKQLGDSMGEYLYALDFFYRRVHQRQDAWVQDLFETLRREKKATQFVGWAVSGLAHWKTIVNAESAAPPFTPIRMHLRRLSLLRTGDWKPVALAILIGKHANKARLVARLEVACVAMHLVQESTRERARFLAESIKSLEKGGGDWRVYALTPQRVDRIQRMLTRGAMDDATARFFLRWLEATRWGKDAPQYLSSASLEHVFPKTVPGGSPWLRQFPDRAQHAFYLRQVGNLALVDEETNTVLANSPFDEKKAIVTPLQGQYKLLDDLFQSPGWGEQDILQRTQRLTAETFALLEQA